MGHGEAVEDKAEEGGHGGAGGNNPEGGQQRERLCGKAFAGGGDEGRDGVPGGQPAGKAFGAGGVDDGREEHQELRDDGDASPDVAIEASQGGEREADGEAGEEKRGHGKWKE